MLTLVGQSEAAAASAAADTIWRVDAKIAAASLSNQELADVDKTYNIYTMEQQAMFPGWIWRRFCADRTDTYQPHSGHGPWKAPGMGGDL